MSSRPRSSSRIMLLVGFPVHEFSHALAAYRLGDGTAKLFGRLTLNPIAHFDPLGGTLLALTFIGSAAAGGAFGFGWAKPTPVNPMNLAGRPARRGDRRGGRARSRTSSWPRPPRLPLRFILAQPGSWSCQRPRRRGPVPVRPDQPAADGLQPHPGPAARRLEGAVRVHGPPDRVPDPAVPRAVRLHHPDRPVLLIFPPGGLRSARPDRRCRHPRCVHQPPGGRLRPASSGRTCGRASRPGSARRWRPGSTPAQLALFDAMHVADRRHGLDVVASLRAEGVDASRTSSSPACSTTRARATRASGRGSRTRSGSATARGSGGPPRSCPGSALRSSGSATTPRPRRCMAAAAGCSAADRRADPPPGRAPRPGVRRAAAARRRGELMTLRIAERAGHGRADRLGHGRRPGRPLRRRAAGPRAATQVQMAEFDGPLGLLLSLIEARQLDVLTVPLGALADAYLDALAGSRPTGSATSASFVAVASQLILIKSRAMLPRRTDPTRPTALADEGTDPEAELRARLLLYRAHRDAGLRLAERRARPDRAVPARAGGGPRRGARRRPAAGCAAARPASARPGARPARRDRAAARAAARGRWRRTITIDGAGRPHPGGPPRRAHGRPPGPARRRPRPGRRRGHVPRDARAHEAARDRRRAGRAVGSDRGPRDDAPRNGRPRASTAVAADAPIDESLESFA